MFILAEKPSVAKDFAAALNCKWSKAGFFSNSDSSIVIAHCVGHLFSLEQPNHYGSDIPIIPKSFDYCINPNTEIQSKLVLKLLTAHKNDDILIATDADREGEIIARECLYQAHISDFSKIKRFWVSQALTKEVILDGIKTSKKLDNYEVLAFQGFARQHADWLVGMNFSRYITKISTQKLPVGRVQTAVLSAIDSRCNEIQNFVSKKYFTFQGVFKPTRVGSDSVISCKGYYFEKDDKNIISKFDNDFSDNLKKVIGLNAQLIDSKSENGKELPPELFNLNACQKVAFKKFGYSAEMTLEIIQSLYEKLKCVSYPRTPSRVMGSQNVELCASIYNELCNYYEKYKVLTNFANISLQNKHVFNDKKLEAHHALIPLKPLPESCTQEQSNIYFLILEQFLLAFLPEHTYKSTCHILKVENFLFNITGKTLKDPGWKSFLNLFPLHAADRQMSVDKSDDEDLDDNSQILDNIDWNALYLTDIISKQKWTKPPKYYNEASILSFMENPKLDRQMSVQTDEPSNVGSKLVGLGTPATRHTFIPKLQKYNYIKLDGKNILVTDLGKILLQSIRNSNISSLADISSTTDWEERLDKNPIQFELDMKTFVASSISNSNFDASSLPKIESSTLSCPKCNKALREGAKNWFCSGYKDGCNFSFWKSSSGTSFSKADLEKLLAHKSVTKTCKKRDGSGSYKASFSLSSDFSLERTFINK